jgi:hypothetical protein
MRDVEPPAAKLKEQLIRAYLLMRDPTPEGLSLPEASLQRLVYIWRRDRWARSLRRRLPGVDTVPLDRPIFLLGVQGGGLTILARALQRNSAIVSMAGNSSYWTALNELGNEPNRMRRLPRSLWNCKFRHDIDHPPFGHCHSGAYACDQLLPYYRRTASEATDDAARAFKRLIREHIATYASDPRKARFLDKTQAYTVSVGYVDALLSGCEPHFVLVVRNPYAMVHHLMRPGWPVYVADVEYKQQLEVAAQHWANSTRHALEDGERVKHFHTVRFEDFLADPEAVVASICRFAGLSYDSDMVPREHHVQPWGTLPGDDKWYPLRGDIEPPDTGPDEAALIERYCGDLAARLGYAPRSPSRRGEMSERAA